MVTRVILAAIVASLVWFVLGGILYMNSYSKKIFDKESKRSKAVRKWKDMKQFYMLHQILTLNLQKLRLLPPVLNKVIRFPSSRIFSFAKKQHRMCFLFGLILMGIKIIPHFADLKIMTHYPKKLLTMDFIVGSINCFAVAFVIASIV